MKLIALAESVNAIFNDEIWLNVHNDRERFLAETEYYRLFDEAKEKIIIAGGKFYRYFCENYEFEREISNKSQKVDIETFPLPEHANLELMIIDNENIFLATKDGTVLIAKNRPLCGFYMEDIYNLN